MAPTAYLDTILKRSVSAAVVLVSPQVAASPPVVIVVATYDWLGPNRRMVSAYLFVPNPHRAIAGPSDLPMLGQFIDSVGQVQNNRLVFRGHVDD